MRLALQPLLADHPGQVQILRIGFHAGLLFELPHRAVVGTLARIGFELAAAGTPEPQIRLEVAAQEEHPVRLVKAIKQGRDFIGLTHRVYKNGAEVSSICPLF